LLAKYPDGVEKKRLPADGTKRFFFVADEEAN
jgi:hypothetical protein